MFSGAGDLLWGHCYTYERSQCQLNLRHHHKRTRDAIKIPKKIHRGENSDKVFGCADQNATIPVHCVENATHFLCDPCKLEAFKKLIDGEIAWSGFLPVEIFQ